MNYTSRAIPTLAGQEVNYCVSADICSWKSATIHRSGVLWQKMVIVRLKLMEYKVNSTEIQTFALINHKFFKSPNEFYSLLSMLMSQPTRRESNETRAKMYALSSNRLTWHSSEWHNSSSAAIAIYRRMFWYYRHIMFLRRNELSSAPLHALSSVSVAGDILMTFTCSRAILRESEPSPGLLLQ